MSEEDRAIWDQRYRLRREQAATALEEPCRFFVDHADALPRSGRALDIGGGAGRNALWLARRALAVTLVDISQVGLATAAERAAAEGLSLTTFALDLEAEALPPGPFELVICSHFLVRPRLAEVAAVLAPGGLFLMTHPTRRNLERHPRPSARFLLAEGELPSLCAGLTLRHYVEGWNADGRHEAEIIAVK